MAKNDVAVLNNSLGVFNLRAEDRDTSSIVATLKQGEMVKRGGTGGNFCTLMLTGDPEAGTDIMLGVVAEESDETDTADGNVDVAIVGPGTLLEANATTAANIDTADELNGIILDYISMDGPAAATTASFNYTFDENEGDDPNVHGFCVVGGNTTKGRLRCLVAAGHLFGSTV